MNTLDSIIIESPFEEAEECSLFTIDDVDTPFTLHDITMIDQIYVLGFWIKGDAESHITVGNMLVPVTTEWVRHVLKFVATEHDIPIAFMSNGTYYIYHPKLEIGNVDTDWTEAPEDADEKFDQTSDEMHQLLIEHNTEITKNCETIILSALKSYTATNDFETYRETVSTQLQLLSDSITMNFQKSIDEINNVDGDMQSKFNEFYKHISFSDNGIIIKSGDSQMELQLDNEAGIIFSKNGISFGRWDGEDFYTGNIVVEVNERAQFGNFAFIPRSDNSLMFLKVGG